jgi:DNA topoisomerase-6 subunit A
MLNYIWFKPRAWQRELKNMMKTGQKLELEALSSRGIRFISQKYLPDKINNREFLS